ncbi:hypothetical protein [Rhizobium sp. AG855]|uniref:hypothetical protein n=1 Tax=Rhizobium sp. AG855 TaxID=2183898 RepID=UPI000E73B092|nr:hypothetical protein [Rhizobium sp. AG855]RKE76946.1 hypothetical protein DFO46_4693 [Rhizobium sp. AG855]
MHILDEAIVELCSFKDALDQYIEVKDAAALGDVNLEITPTDSGPILRLPRQAIPPRFFLEQVLPFSSPKFELENVACDTFSPRRVIGGTFGRYGLVEPSIVMDTSDKLVADNRLDHPQSARVTQVGELKLFVAYEGKNRIELFKKFRRTMKAFVSPSPFPKSAELALVRFTFTEHWGVEFKGDLRVLPYPKPVVRLLAAYGVTTHRSSFDPFIASKVKKLRRGILSQRMTG